MIDLNSLIKNFINDPADPENNFALAQYYYNIGQTASAVSYFIRTAERTSDELLKYECLISAAKCLERQGTRSFSVQGMLMHAVSLMPKRPEAYYLMSKFYELDKADGNWFRCYMMSSIGLDVCIFDNPPLRTNFNFPGKSGLLFQKALSAWWCGLCDDSRTMFGDLLNNHQLDEDHTLAVLRNLQQMNGLQTNKGLILYDKSKHSKLKVKFKDSEKIEKNFSEAYQDMFVLTMLDGKRNGTYLEIGAGNSFYGNNTALLEQNYNWTGVALDIDERFVEAHTKERKNPCLLKDATIINYDKFLSGLNFSTTIDYLQLDCDPPEVTYKILLQMPFEKYKFAVITYEHDHYCDETKSFQEKSRKYLESYGYVRVVNNISPDNSRPYEDWWIHPELINPQIVNLMKDISQATKKAEDYILGDVKEEHKHEFKLEKTYYGEFDTDKYIRENFFPDLSYKGTIVDVGAGPPTFISNSKHFRDTGWRAICVDPNPKFVQQHRDAGHEIYEYACSFEETDSEFIINYNNDDWYTKENDGVSFSALAIKYSGVPEHNTQEKIKVKTIKLNSILEQAKVDKVDVLTIDTEGWELEVLMGFDHVKYSPKVIVLENYENSKKYEAYMNRCGYQKKTNLSYNEIYVKV